MTIYLAIAKMPTENWCKFDTVSRANAFTMEGTPVFVGGNRIGNLPDPLFERRVVVRGGESLASGFTKEDMEREILELTGVKAKYSKDKKAAAVKLWHAVVEFGKDPYVRKDSGGEEVKIKTGPKKANQVFTINGASDEVIAALPRQARVIVDCIRELKEKEGNPTYARLKTKLQGSAAELKTKQDPWRIFSYYRARLIEDGILKIERA